MADFSTILQALKHRAAHKGDKPVFIFRDHLGTRYLQTFKQVYLLGGRFAAILRAGGVGRGHLVVNTLANCPERVVCEAGILMSGAASVNGQCMLADGSDLLNTIRSSGASAVIVDPDMAHSPWPVLQKQVTLNDDNTISSDVIPFLNRVYFVRRNPQCQDDFLSKMEDSSDWFMADDVKAGDNCSVFTTSGTSGFSKLVVHTHDGLTQAVLRNNPVFDGLSGEEVEFSMAPLGWLGGYAGNNIISGTVRVLCDTRDGPPADLVAFILECIEEENVDLSFVPAPRLGPLYESLKRKKKDEGHPAESLQILKRITLGGQPITKALVQTACLLARSVLIIYGTTESFIVSSLQVTDPAEYRDFDSGHLVKGGQLKIVSEDNESVPLIGPGVVGRILFKRRVMMREYLNDPEATAAAITRDGFFRTDDIGHLDDRGHVIVKGRRSDAIMQGPYIFYPSWLEERIKACPGVRDVMVVGVPDAASNEEICACVTLTSESVTALQVQAFVENDIVTPAEEPLSPRPRHYLTFDSFPITTTGKPHRKIIKQQAAARLSASPDKLS